MHRFRSLFFILIVGFSSLSCAAQSLLPSVDSSAWSERTLASLSLEQKVSQLFAARAYGYFDSTDDEAYIRLRELVVRSQVGGVIFFQGEPLEQAELINELQSLAPVPLLISQDMEWGPAMRIEHTTSLPKMMAIGATRNPSLAYSAGYVTAREAQALGTDQIFAPVADVNNNPMNPIINVRSFGENPKLVARLVGPFIKGIQDAGLIATAKHFPGHGDTATDSHAGLPIIPYGRTRLDTLELIPFKAAINAGVESIMVAHIAFPKLEESPHLPATLSPRITTGLLRKDLGFKGLIVTDAMNMAGVTKAFGIGEAAIRAIEAGADMILMSPDIDAARAAVMRALSDGRLSENRIDASVRRILEAKEGVGLNRRSAIDLEAARRVVSSRRHRMLGEVIARSSLTLLRNANSLLPISDIPQRILSVTLSDGTDASTGNYFTRRIREIGRNATISRLLLDKRSAPEEYTEAVKVASTADVILVPAYVRVRSSTGNISLPVRQRQFLDQLTALGKPVVLISFGNPYVPMELVRQPDAYIAAYGGSNAAQRVVAQAVFGMSGFHGRLPVTIPGLYHYGDGIDIESSVLRPGFPEEEGMDGRRLNRVDSLMRVSIDAKAFPAAAVAIGRGQSLVKLKGYGYRTYKSEQGITPQSQFDLASLTKVIATTTAAMQLYETGHLDLDATVASYLPEFAQNGKETVTIRQLLTHTSGLIPFRPFYRMGSYTGKEVREAILADSLIFPPGSETRYSDFNMITLAFVIEKISGEKFATYCRDHIFSPLNMTHTGFRGLEPDTTIVPTEIDTTFRHRLVEGFVHDETAYMLGGTAGHAGLFSTAEDLSKFAYMMIHDGYVSGHQFLKPETIALFTTRANPAGESTRALGWDTKSMEGYSSAGHYFGPHSFGHTGFTGTSIWIDPDAKLFVVLLTNRVYPTRENRKHRIVRAEIADLAYLSIMGPPRPLLPGISTN